MTPYANNNRERVRGWTIVHCTAWSIGAGQVFPHQVETVRWLLGVA